MTARYYITKNNSRVTANDCRKRERGQDRNGMGEIYPELLIAKTDLWGGDRRTTLMRHEAKSVRPSHPRIKAALFLLPP
jgi:hypothetical protein